MATDLVVVSVGTDHHRFDRLVAWMDQWAADHPAARVVIQRGGSPAAAHCESHRLIPYGALNELFAAATVVVSHGGPSTVMDARAAGRFPIVVPRDPARGEHVDDHQIRFSRHLDHHGLAAVATERPALEAAVQTVIGSPARYSVSADPGARPGVVAFGRVIEDLIGPGAGLPRTTIAEARRRRGRS